MKQDAIAVNETDENALALLATAGADLTRINERDLVLHLDALDKEAEAYSEGTHEARTRETYKWAWDRFSAWCIRRRLSPLPVEGSTLVRFLVGAAKFGIEPLKAPSPGVMPRDTKPIAASTIKIYLSAIASEHKLAELPMPELSVKEKRTLEGISKEKKKVRVVQKSAFSEAQLKTVLDGYPDTLIGLRNKALVLAAYASGGRRRSEVVAMRVDQLHEVTDGYLWGIPHTKTSPTGMDVYVPRKHEDLPSPFDVLRLWLSRANISAGPVFLSVNRHGKVGKKAVSGRVLAELLKDAASSLGLPEAAFSGHSLRSSFITNSLLAGKRLDWIMRRTGHKSVDVFMKYARELGVTL